MNYDHCNITYKYPHMITHEIRNGIEAKSDTHESGNNRIESEQEYR